MRLRATPSPAQTVCIVHRKVIYFRKRFEGLFCCTTNLVEHLDPASLLRASALLRQQMFSAEDSICPAVI